MRLAFRAGPRWSRLLPMTRRMLPGPRRPGRLLTRPGPAGCALAVTSAADLRRLTACAADHCTAVRAAATMMPEPVATAAASKISAMARRQTAMAGPIVAMMMSAMTTAAMALVCRSCLVAARRPTHDRPPGLGSVKHATHLFRIGLGWAWCGWPGQGMTSPPGPVSVGQNVGLASHPDVDGQPG